MDNLVFSARKRRKDFEDDDTVLTPKKARLRYDIF